jgi:hypothetical protein
MRGREPEQVFSTANKPPLLIGWRFFCAVIPDANHESAMNHRNPDHHIWNNNGTWWCHYTEHLPDYTKRRVRLNLHTDNRFVARVLRDSVLFERFGACAR